MVEIEASGFLRRYPVPLMATAFDDTGSLISMDEIRETSHVCGWPTTGEPHLTWRPDELTNHLKPEPESQDLTTIFEGVPYRTRTEVRDNANKWASERRLQNSVLKLVLVFWLALIPAGLATIQYFGPEWIALAAFLFVLGKALHVGLRLTGRLNESAATTKESEKDQRMRHYFYHCERNPIGFARLKVENSAADERARIQAEAAELTKGETHAGSPTFNRD